MAILAAAPAQGDDASSCPAPLAVRAAHSRPVLAPGQRPWSMTPLAAPPPRTPAAVAPAPHSEARRHLLRRLTFLMSGLPPREDDAEAFLADVSPRALDKVIDRLLAAATATQRLTEVWLRATDYADRWPGETPGAAATEPTEGWRYRDWVVTTLRTTRDPRPLARLTLAGDAVSGSDSGTPNRAGLLATLWQVTAMPVADDFEETVMRWAGRQAERTSQAFLGLDLTCARCHDHPSLPLPSAEAAGLVAIFAHSHAYVRGENGAPVLNRVSTGTPALRQQRAKALAAIEAEEAAIDSRRREFALLTAAEFLPQTAEYVRAAWAWHRQPTGSLAAFSATRGLLEGPLERWLSVLGLTGEPPAHSLTASWWATWTTARETGTPEAIAAAARILQDTHQADAHSPFFNPAPAMDAFFTLDQQVQLSRQTEKVAALRRRLPADPQLPGLAEGPPPGMDPPALPPHLPVLLTGGTIPMEITPPAAGRRALATWLEGEGATFFLRLAALRLAEGLGHPLLPEPSALGLWAAERPPTAATVDAIAARLQAGGWPAAARHILELQALNPELPPLQLGDTEWRDAILFVAGTLDARQGGPPDPSPTSPRRSLYREWAPLPSPPDDAFLETQAAALAALARSKAGNDPSVQVNFITFRLFQRQATAAERAGLGDRDDLVTFCRQLLQSGEFRTLP